MAIWQNKATCDGKRHCKAQVDLENCGRNCSLRRRTKCSAIGKTKPISCFLSIAWSLQARLGRRFDHGRTTIFEPWWVIRAMLRQLAIPADSVINNVVAWQRGP